LEMIRILVKTLNDNFGEPFLPRGFFKAAVAKHKGRVDGINIFIGPRDIHLLDTGKVASAGTVASDFSKWDIQRRNIDDAVAEDIDGGTRSDDSCNPEPLDD